MKGVSAALLTTLSLLFLAGCGDDGKKEGTPRGAEAPQSASGATGDLTAIPPESFDRIVELFNRGVSLMERYNPVEAVKALEQVVELAPDWTTGRLNLGIALLNAQDDAYNVRAEDELKKVILQDPDNPYAHYALAMLLKHLTRNEEAKVLLERVLEIDPDDPDTHYQLAVLETDPEVAQIHLEKTLERMPHHESACYRLQSLLRQAGEEERAQDLLLRFKALKTAGAGAVFGMKYSEMGRYASVIRSFEGPTDPGGAQDPPAFVDVAEEAGLLLTSRGEPGWPGETAGRDVPPSNGPGVAVDDVDGDGDLDLYFPGVAPGENGALYVNDAGRFSKADDCGVDGRGALGAYFGDYDKDGDPDLYLTCVGANRLYQNQGDGTFVDATDATGTAGREYTSIGAAWADADHDGDLDLYVANFAAYEPSTASHGGAPNALWRNNGDGTFTDVASEDGVDGGDAPTMGVIFFDVDGDQDLDLYLVNHRRSNQLFLNHRVGQYTDATSRYEELGDDGPGLGALLADVDGNGLEDLLLIRGTEPPRLFLKADRGRFIEDHAFAAASRTWGGAVGGLAGDYDLDGDIDLVILGVGENTTGHHLTVMNAGGGRFASAVPFGPPGQEPSARGAVAADLDGNGSLELIVARAGFRPELWRAPVDGGRHWLEVIPSLTMDEEITHWPDPTSVGLAVELKSGPRLQVASVTTSAGYLGGFPPRVHFGLGERGKADYVRLVWADAVLQSEMEVTADQAWQVTKVKRKPSSCPLLFAWDGRRFVFVTDFLGVGGVGFFMTPGEYAPPDPTEDVRIPPETIAPRGGRYLLRVAEPLEEVSYIDELHLLAYDHPDDWELYPDERFTGTPPFPTGRPYAAADKIFPVAARDHRSESVLDRLLDIDRRYVEPPKDSRFEGYAEDHWIELDFGDRLRALDTARTLVLYLYGWVEYTYSHVNYAAYQAGLAMRSPWIEVPDADGTWRPVVAEAGFPAGLPRMMTLDVSRLPIRTEGRFRIRTNMEIFWDQIFVAEDASDADLRVHTLRPEVAELRFLGYPREYSPDGRDPTLYDYHRLDLGVPFKNLTGAVTRFGDVRPLLDAVDDHFVIMARGEEIALEFDANALPDLPPGWSRTFVLHVDGYCKDMDLYTAFPHTVRPLPYHGMENYPPLEELAAEEHKRYERTWNTRRVVGQ